MSFDKNYHQVIISGSNIQSVSQYINVPFKSNCVKVIASYYNVVTTDLSIRRQFFVISDLVDNQVICPIAYQNGGASNFTFDLNPNVNISNLYTFSLFEKTTTGFGIPATTPPGEWTIVLQFLKHQTTK